MFVHPKMKSELILDLTAFEKKTQSEIENTAQIMKVSEIIKTVARQSKITDYDGVKPVWGKTILASEKYQLLVNALSFKLEAEHGIKTTCINIESYSMFVDQKFKKLSIPDDHDGIPDLQGNDSKGTIHLGIVILDENDPIVNKKLKSFSSRSMKGTKTPVPLHVMVPKELRDKMEFKIRQIGLGDKLDFGIITVHA